MGWSLIWSRSYGCFQHGHSKKQMVYGVQLSSITAARKGWEEFAIGNQRIEYHRGAEGFVPEAGDIVVYDRVFENKDHDHIGIVLEKRKRTILAAEGNVNDKSVMIERPVDEHIRAFIRIPDGYRYEAV